MRTLLPMVAATVLMIVTGVAGTADAAFRYRTYNPSSGVESQAAGTATGGPVGGFADRN